MKRLTSCKKRNYKRKYDVTVEQIEIKLGQYEDAEAEERLLILPCKLGDSVYIVYLTGEYGVSWWTIDTREFSLEFYEKYKNYYDGNYNRILNGYVYYSEDEANTKLKELIGG